jgi:hypothetical protein
MFKCVCYSCDVVGLRAFKTIELTYQGLVVRSHVSEHQPVIFLQRRNHFVLQNKVDSIASLTPQEAQLRVLAPPSNGLFVFNQQLPFKKLGVVGNTPDALVNSRVEVVVVDVHDLFLHENLGTNSTGLLGYLSSWLSHHLDLLVLTWENLFEVFVNFGSDDREAIVLHVGALSEMVSRVIRKTTADVQHIHGWKTHLQSQIKDRFSIFEAFLVSFEITTSASDVE